MKNYCDDMRTILGEFGDILRDEHVPANLLAELQRMAEERLKSHTA